MPPSTERPVIAVLCERAPDSPSADGGDANVDGGGEVGGGDTEFAGGGTARVAGSDAKVVGGGDADLDGGGDVRAGGGEARLSGGGDARGGAAGGGDVGVASGGSAGSGGPGVGGGDAGGAGGGDAGGGGAGAGGGGDGLRRPPGVEGLGVEFRYCDAEGLREAVRGARGLLLWDFFSTAVRDVWDDAGTLEWIHVTAAGVDTLLFDELRDSDVVVTNAHGVFDRPIAEYVLGAVIAQAKDSRTSFDLQRRHEWRHRETRSVRGAKALVVGTGAIGREIARLLRAAGLEVRGAGRTARSGDPDFGEVVASSNLVNEVGEVDHLVLAAPLTAATRGLIDAKVLAAMKPDAHLINVARGPIVDETALLNALQERRIAATLDVFDREPLTSDHPLWDAPGATITAHMSGDVIGWRDALAAQFVNNLQRWLAGEPLINVVDKKLGYIPSGDR